MHDRLKYYDGLRGIAALWVAAIHFHCAFRWPTIAQSQLTIRDMCLRLLLNGDLCVYIFWLLSGIVITYRFLHSRHELRSEVIAFPVKRYLRLAVPAVAASAIAFCLMKLDLMYLHEAARQAQYMGDREWVSAFYNFQPSALSFIRASLFDVFLAGNSSYDPPLWTIAPELFGPVLLGLLLTVHAHNPDRLAYYMLWFIVFLIGSLSNVTYLHYILFIVGILITESTYRKEEIMRFRLFSSVFSSAAFGWLTLVISLITEYLFPTGGSWQGFLIIPLRAIGVICIVRNSSFLKRALSLRLFQFLGRISYPVYLLHFPLIYSLISWLYLESPDFLRNQYALLLLIFIGLLLAASWVFYKTVEVPAVRMARTTASRLFV